MFYPIAQTVEFRTSIAKLLRGLNISGMVFQLLVCGLNFSPVFIRVIPLKPPSA